MVQTMETSLFCHAPEAAPVRSDPVVGARSHRPHTKVELQEVNVDTILNTATPVEPPQVDVAEHALYVAAEAGGGEEEGGWGAGAVGFNFIAAGAGSR